MISSINKLRKKDSWLFITLGLILYFFIKEFDAVGDFPIFFQAGKGLSLNQDIYVQNYYNGMHYFYSPLFAVILSWFSFLSDENFSLVWKVLNILAFYRLFELLKWYLLEDLEQKDLNRIFLFAFMAFVAPIYKCIHLLQFNLVMFWGIMESLRLFKGNKWVLGAFILGFFCNVKIIPITVIIYLLYRNEFKGAFSSLLFAGLFLVLPAVFIGWDYNLTLLKSWFSVMNPSSENNVVALFVNAEKEFASIPTLIPVWFTDSSYADTAFESRRHFLELPNEWIKGIIYGCQLILVGLNLYFLKSLPFKNEQDRQKELWEISFLLLSTVLIAPRQQLYAFVYLMPAMLYLVYFFYCKFMRKEIEKWIVWLVAFIIIVLLINLEFYVGNFRMYYHYIKSLGLGSLLLILPLVYLSPARLKQR